MPEVCSCRSKLEKYNQFTQLAVVTMRLRQFVVRPYLCVWNRMILVLFSTLKLVVLSCSIPQKMSYIRYNIVEQASESFCLPNITQTN